MGRIAILFDAVLFHHLAVDPSGWGDISDSLFRQDRVFHILAALYGIVAAVAMIQLVRIQSRVPEFAWTTQKVFHFLNFAVTGVRCLVFVYLRNIQALHQEIIQRVALDMPGLIFLTTYTVLVLFWAEIYYQANTDSTARRLRPTFFIINCFVYITQITLWVLVSWNPTRVLIVLSKLFFAAVSLCAALGFLLFGGRLSFKLMQFPVESEGRQKKLREVGYVTTVCSACFVVRCVFICVDAFDRNADLNVLKHPLLNLIYYLLVEILPSAIVLFILRKLPARRLQYRPIS